jgi:hypothetical protein
LRRIPDSVWVVRNSNGSSRDRNYAPLAGIKRTRLGKFGPKLAHGWSWLESLFDERSKLRKLRNRFPVASPKGDQPEELERTGEHKPAADKASSVNVLEQQARDSSHGQFTDSLL